MKRPLVLVLGIVTACTVAPVDDERPQPASQPASQSASQPASRPQSQPVPVAVEFTGNDSLPGFRLERVIADPLADLARDPTRESPLLDASLDLRDHYLSEGFPEATVAYTLRPAPRTVVFQIAEGPRVTVAELRLRGVIALPEDLLLSFWNRRRSGLLGTGAPLLVEDELRSLAAAIRTRYRAEGFLDAEVRGPDIQRAPHADTARVTLTVQEGLRWQFGAVTVDPGLAPPPDTAAFAALPGTPFLEAELARLRVALRRQYEDLGFPEPQVRVRTERDANARRVALHIGGTPGVRATVTAVRIRGNHRSSSDWIRNRIELVPGQPFHGRKLDDSVAALYRTGVFRTVAVERTTPAPDQLELTFVVDEDDSRALSLLAGYGSYELLRTGVFVTERNLFGVGQTLNLGARLSFKGYRGDLTWTEPLLLGTDTTLSLSTFYEERVEPSFVDDSLGGTAALRRDLGHALQARLGYTLEHRRARDVDPSVTLGADQQFQSGVAFLELGWDTRDSPIFPSSGQRLAVKYERSDPALLGTLQYDRVVLRGAAFWDLGAGFGAAAGAETGVIWFHDPGLLPVQERFFNGGESTVRSFRESQLGPQSTSGEPAGGEFRNVGSLELRLPILGALGAAGFADAGNVGTRAQDYGLRDLRYAVGAGLRLALPVGPLRLDFGLNPDPRPGEDRYALHLSVGFPF